MTIQQIDDLLINNNLDKVKEILQLNYDVDVIKTALKQYDPAQHDVFDKSKREDRPYGRTQKNSDDTETFIIEGYKPVNRIAFAIQKQIVFSRCMFIGMPAMSAKADEQIEKDVLKILGKIWHDNKMDYKFNETKKRTMSELRCAWLWYNVKEEGYWDGHPINSNIKPKVKILSHELGDALYPVMDDNDDLIAFGRGYNTIVYDEKNNKTEVEHLDVYTSKRFYFKKREKGAWSDNFPADAVAVSLKDNEGNVTSSYMENTVGKIPVTYFYQPLPEWSDIQTAGERIEELKSNHGDANDYNAWPILFGKGTTLSLPNTKTGKYIEGSADADLKFVNWDNLPHGIKMEVDLLLDNVYGISNTVRFKDFETLGPMSGFATQLRFLLPMLRAKDCEMSVFGESVQRAYNYLKMLISVLDKKYVKTLSLQIIPTFTSVLPQDQLEIINKVKAAKEAGMISDETSIEINPLLEDVEAEKERIKKEKESVVPINVKGNAFGQNNGNGIVKNDVLKEPASV